MKSFSFAIFRHSFNNILNTIACQWHIWVIRTMWYSYTGEQEPIKIINLSDCPNSGAWVVRHGLLMDGDSWGKSSDLTNTSCLRDIWYDHAGIRREWFQISLLSLSIEGIEGKGGLSRSWDPRDDCELIFRDRDSDVFEIVRLSRDDIYSIWHSWVGLEFSTWCKEYAYELLCPMITEHPSTLMCCCSCWDHIIDEEHGMRKYNWIIYCKAIFSIFKSFCSGKLWLPHRKPGSQWLHIWNIEFFWESSEYHIHMIKSS